MRLNRAILYFLLLFSSFFIVNCSDVTEVHQLQNNSLQKSKNHQFKSLRTHGSYQHRAASTNRNGLWAIVIKNIIGPIMFFSSFIIIWLNEKKTAIDFVRMELAEKICQEVDPFDRTQVRAAQGKLTFVMGQTATDQIIADKLSGVEVVGAMKLIRTVEVNEWRAAIKQQNSQKHVVYTLQWSKTHELRAGTKTNPPENWFTRSNAFYNEKVFIGQYNLTKQQIDMCTQLVNIPPNLDEAEVIIKNKKLIISQKRKIKGTIQDEYIYFPSPVDGEIDGQGALRIKYDYVPVGPISIIAKTKQNSFQAFSIIEYQGEPHMDDIGQCCHLLSCVQDYLQPIQVINCICQQKLRPDEIFERQRLKSFKFVFIVRGISFVIMFIGLLCLYSPVITILGYLPTLGFLFNGPIIFIDISGSFIVTLPLWIMTVSLAWIWYNPRVGMFFFAIGLSIFIALFVIIKMNEADDPPAEQQPPAKEVVQHFLRYMKG